MVLSERQQSALHASIVEYLGKANLDESVLSSVAKGLGVEAPEGGNENHSTNKTTLLEKKWSSVVRLQRKVLELEEALKSAPTGGRLGTGLAAGGGGRCIPSSEPPPLVCKGHRGGGINSVSFHPIFSLLASAGEDGSVKLWDSESGEFMKTLKGHTGSVQHVAFDDKGGKLLSCSSDLSLKIWDAEQEYVCVKTLRGHSHNVSMAKFLRGDQEGTIASTGRDGAIKFWDLQTGFCTHTIQPTSDPPVWIRAMAISPSGRSFVTGGNDGAVIVWDTEGKKARHEMRGHEHVVNAVAYPPVDAGGDEKGKENMVVSAGRDKTVRVWDAATGVEVCIFRNHSNWVRGVLIHKSLNYVLSVSDDRSMMVFDYKNRRMVREIKEAGGHFVQTLDMHKTLGIVVTGGVDNEVRIWKCD